MSAGFKAVQWNRRKLIYDGILIAGVVLFIGTFMIIGALRNPPADMPAWINLRIKAFGTCAFTGPGQTNAQSKRTTRTRIIGPPTCSPFERPGRAACRQ